MSVTNLREGLATNLATISGLRTAAEIPDNPSPPIAVVSLNNIQFDRAFQRGLTEYSFTVSIIVGRAAEREAQRRLDSYASSTGASSVKLAIESDKTLGGYAYDCRVVSMDSIGAVQLNDATYLGMDFSVTAYAQ